VPYARTVQTKSGSTAVRVVWSSRRGSREIEHIGSAHDDAELEALKAAAGQRIAAGQTELDLGLGDSMISDADMKDIEAAGLSFILGMKVPDVRTATLPSKRP
jgi:hypothetical protein